VRPIRVWAVAAVLLLCGLAAGCGGAKERGKNQDYDRPKPTEKK
jgi:hypothetical protein